MELCRIVMGELAREGIETFLKRKRNGAWATVNKDSGGGEKPGGSGYGKHMSHHAAHKGDHPRQ